MCNVVAMVVVVVVIVAVAVVDRYLNSLKYSETLFKSFKCN